MYFTDINNKIILTEIFFIQTVNCLKKRKVPRLVVLGVGGAVPAVEARPDTARPLDVHHKHLIIIDKY